MCDFNSKAWAISLTTLDSDCSHCTALRALAQPIIGCTYIPVHLKFAAHLALPLLPIYRSGWRTCWLSWLNFPWERLNAAWCLLWRALYCCRTHRRKALTFKRLQMIRSNRRALICWSDQLNSEGCWLELGGVWGRASWWLACGLWIQLLCAFAYKTHRRSNRRALRWWLELDLKVWRRTC